MLLGFIPNSTISRTEVFLTERGIDLSSQCRLGIDSLFKVASFKNISCIGV